MEVIRELVKVINLKKIKKVNTLYAEKPEEDVYSRMYHLVANDVDFDLTEDDISYELAGVEKKSKKYGMIKTRFIKKALNQVVFTDLSDNISENAKEIFKANRLAFLTRLLYSVGAKKSALLLYNKAIPLLEKHELLELLINLYKIKLANYSSLNKTKKFNDLCEKLNKSVENIATETKTIIIYERIGKLYNKSEILRKSDFYELKKEIEKLNKLPINENSTFLSQWNKKRLIIEYNQYLGNYQKVLDELGFINEKFEKKKHFYLKPRKIIIQTWKLEAYGILTKRREGEELISILNKENKLINYNWFHIQRKIVFFYINSEQYGRAYETTEKVIKVEEFKNYNKTFKELWLLWHTFLKVYYYKADIVKLKEIKIYKVVNSIQKISKDKLGVNTLRIVLEIFYNILINNQDEIIESYNTLSIYKSRYLKPNRLNRSILFLDFITKSSRSAFQKNNLRLNAEKTITGLGQLKLSEVEKKAYEVIPYETIINVITETKL